jgi:hypothetical protein
MIGRLSGLYMIDLLCDEDVQSFHERLGFRRAVGMCIGNHDTQSGAEHVVMP